MKHFAYNVKKVIDGDTCGVFVVKGDRLQLTAAHGGGDTAVPKTGRDSDVVYGAWKGKRSQLTVEKDSGNKEQAEPNDIFAMGSPVVLFEATDAGR